MPTRKRWICDQKMRRSEDQEMGRARTASAEMREAATASKMETVRRMEHPVLRQNNFKPLEFEGFTKRQPNDFHLG